LTITASHTGQLLPADGVSEREQALVIGDRQIRYRLRISTRAKRIRLEVTHDKGLLVVVPKRYRLTDVPILLRSKSSWILRKLDLVARERSESPGTSANKLQDGAQVLYRGNHLVLSVLKKNGGKAEARLVGDHLRIVTSGSERPVEAVLDAWYRREANRVLRERVADLAARFGVSYSRVFVRNQRTRWGSCSTRRNINLNWRLILMPDEVINYIVIHELTHLEELNHSKRFWELVGIRCPNYRQYKTWLRRNSPALMQR